MEIYYKEPKLKEKYKLLVEEIIKELEKGEIPWKKPWINKLPTNLKTKKQYKGINILSLKYQAERNGYKSYYWLTQIQAFDLKGRIKQEEIENPSYITTVKWEIRKMKSNETGLPYIKAWLMMKEYPVYNLDQTIGIKSDRTTDQINLWDPSEEAKHIIDKFKKKPDIRNHNNQAFYDPSMDYIGIPEITQFIGSDEYYSTLFHELVHSTGHPNRLKRNSFLKAVQFGDVEYAKEELVAELGAIFLCSNCNFLYNSTRKNSTAYIQSWLTALKKDQTLLAVAATQAQRAVDFIFNKKFVIDVVETEENKNLGEFKFEKSVEWVN